MFQFFAISEDEEGRVVKRIPLEGNLQGELSEEFEAQRSDLLPKDAEIISYEPGYKPDDEVFVLKDYPLPDYLKEGLGAPDALPALDDTALEEGHVKSVFGLRLGRRRGQEVVFQNFNAGQVLRRDKRFLFLSDDTFQSSGRVGLRIDDKVTSVIEDRNLYFQSEHLVRRYLDLERFFRAATDEEIEKLLTHPAFAPVDPARFVDTADRWSRRKVTSIRERGILEKVPVREIVEVGEAVGVQVETTTIDGQMKIVFPDEKKRSKKLLRFLDDDLLESPLTDTLYQVSSKRRLEV